VTPGVLLSQNTGFYFGIKELLDNRKMTLYPSATMAGIYAAVDNDRGVWKAPANVGVANIVGPSIPVTEAEQGLLNVDASSGKSINAIRSFTGRGTLVWGARTLDGNSNEWRYVPVRRLFIFAEESIKKATEFVVFEPNDQNTWIRMKSMITSFLTGLWTDGALAGAKPEQAFFVQVGLGETMTPQDILEGRMIVVVGMAAVRPAEFIILRFMHKLQES
jgi:phage tail sheath protein FI